MDRVQQRLVDRMRQLCAEKGIVFSHLPDRAGVGQTHFWAVVKGDSSPTLKVLHRGGDRRGRGGVGQA